MLLKRYRAKRKFDKTHEPWGKIEPHRGRRFVIHKHQARSLHYDLRLEMAGVLKSWAVPKQPPLKKGVKRLAVRVEDHPVDYLNFSGVIPEGNYGAGKVEVWDKGELKVKSQKFPPKADPPRAEKVKIKSKVQNSKTKVNSFKFELKGKKLKGEYALVKLREGKSWLFFKTG